MKVRRDYVLDPKIREEIENFAKETAAKYGDAVDRDNLAPEPLLDEMAKKGILGLAVPEEYGGLSLSFRDLVDSLRIIARESPSIAHILFVHSMSCDFVVRLGSEEVREEILPEVARGRRILALSFTEPKSGTDLASIETRAAREGDVYVIHGEKMFTTNAVYAKTFIVLARTGSPEARHKALSIFAVDKDENVHVGEPIDLMGFRGTGLASVKFEGVKVPAHRLLGEENRGFTPAVTGLGIGRIPFSAISLGIAEGALEEAVKWALRRTSFGRPIFENQAVSFPLAEVMAEIQAVKALITSAAEKVDRGEAPMLESSIAKLLSAELAVKATRVAVQVMGGWGLLRASKVSRLYRDAKAVEIAEGTNEVQKMIIARELARMFRG